MIELTFRSRLGRLLNNHAVFDHISFFDDRIEIENHFPPESIRDVMQNVATLLGASVTIEPCGKRTRTTFYNVELPVLRPARRRSFLVWERGEWRPMSRPRLRASLSAQGVSATQANIIMMECEERGALLLGDVAQILKDVPL